MIIAMICKLYPGMVGFQATDADLGSNADLAYYIESGNVDNNFGIDLNTGAISTLSPLDREHRASYTLLVVVKDLHGKSTKGIPLRDSTVVEVTVKVCNCTCPCIAYPANIYIPCR